MTDRQRGSAYFRSAARVAASLALCWGWSAVSRAATAVSACGTLSTNGATYQLTADLSAPGTCLTITANDATVDLNGHTVSFGSNNAAKMYGILNQGDRNTLKNGTVTQVGNPTADNNSQTGVRWESDSGLVTGLTINVHAHDTFGLVTTGYSEPCPNRNTLTIDGNTVYHTGTTESSRDQFTSEPIRLERPDGITNVTNNTIIGSPQAGIVWLDIDWEGLNRPGRRGCGDNSNIAYNTVRIDDAHYQNAGGFHCYHCPALQVHHNQILGKGQEGIQFDHAWSQAGTNRSRIYANVIDVNGTAADGHSAGTGDTQGIRLRYRPEYVDIYDNTVTVQANDAPGRDQNNAVGIWISGDDGPGGKDVKVWNNTVTTLTDGVANVVAEALHIDCFTDTALSGFEIWGNTFISNHRVFASGYNCGWTVGLDKLRIHDNILRKAAGTTYKYHSHFAVYSPAAQNIMKDIDTTYEGGAAESDFDFESTFGQEPGYDAYWTLTAKVTDRNAAPVQNATVTVTDRLGATQGTCVTDCRGTCKVTVLGMRYRRSGNSNPNPMSVRATKGTDAATASQTVNTKGLTTSLVLANTADAADCSGTGTPPGTPANLLRTDTR